MKWYNVRNVIITDKEMLCVGIFYLIVGIIINLFDKRIKIIYNPY